MESQDFSPIARKKQEVDTSLSLQAIQLLLTGVSPDPAVTLALCVAQVHLGANQGCQAAVRLHTRVETQHEEDYSLSLL